ncbi:MAG: glycerol-3-phosphate dehydrogenase/oxidase [Thaumarchaeota archaeon]|nr:glycerol-3-phosphate dehydrogenase/oxidase [Nitrososphaerota archaeon]
MLVHKSCDALIIGGGIAGCGIARDLALRGVSTILVEKEDFGSGTTSASSRIIHGGVRYLENFEFQLVREGLRERSILLRTVPNLVKPLRFIIPIYKGSSPGRWKIKLGMIAYDLLSVNKSVPSHKFIDPEETTRRIPSLESEGLVGSYVYYDAQVSMVERLCLENVLAAEDVNCIAYNHCEVIKITSSEKEAMSATVRNNLTGEEWSVTFRVLVNCTGPWIDGFLKNASMEEKSPLLTTTKGVHLVSSRLSDDAFALYSKKDGRLFFVIPWMGYSLIGTTDTPFGGSPDNLVTSKEDVAYLEESLGRYFPGVHLEWFATYAGLRPLVNAKSSDPSKISRKYAIIESSRMNNLITVAGVKITEYRSAAEKTADLVCKKLSVRRKSATRKLILTENNYPQDFSKYEKVIPQELCEFLSSIYGHKAIYILDEISRAPGLQEKLCLHNPQIAGQVWFAVKFEHAKTLSDFMLRRTRIGYTKCKGLDALDKVTSIMKEHLNWSEEERKMQNMSYSEYVAQRDEALSPWKDSFSTHIPRDNP